MERLYRRVRAHAPFVGGVEGAAAGRDTVLSRASLETLSALKEDPKDRRFNCGACFSSLAQNSSSLSS